MVEILLLNQIMDILLLIGISSINSFNILLLNNNIHKCDSRAYSYPNPNNTSFQNSNFNGGQQMQYYNSQSKHKYFIYNH